MVSIAEIPKGRHTGKEVELRGWIYRTRSVGGKAFVVVRDATGTVQVAISRDAVPAEAFAAAQKALIESAIVVHGKVVEDKRARVGSRSARTTSRSSTSRRSSRSRRT